LDELVLAIPWSAWFGAAEGTDGWSMITAIVQGELMLLIFWRHASFCRALTPVSPWRHE
jgi:hypothetical protein